MKTPIALILLACPFVLLSLSGCGPKREQVKIPAVVEVPVPTSKPLPASLTDKVDEPPTPPKNCQWRGTPAVCALDGLATIPAWRGKQIQANTDRATAARITADPGKP